MQNKDVIQQGIIQDAEVGFCGLTIFSGILFAFAQPGMHIPVILWLFVGLMAIVFGFDLIRALIANAHLNSEKNN